MRSATCLLPRLRSSEEYSSQRREVRCYLFIGRSRGQKKAINAQSTMITASVNVGGRKFDSSVKHICYSRMYNRTFERNDHRYWFHTCNRFRQIYFCYRISFVAVVTDNFVAVVSRSKKPQKEQKQ